ncbi:MAG TPA: cytochrome c peroxidase [Vicinamibacterales bacterium]|nr:cytochrome c peroxidase [Vicinamibacterales bacterium]
MPPSTRAIGLSVVLVMLSSVAPAVTSPQTREPGLRRPVPVPADNPQTEAKVSLGAQLFFDPRLSADNTISCATCHRPESAWANHDRTDVGIGGKVGPRNSGTILDAAYMKFQFWDGRAETLEAQALGPIHNPMEMGEVLDNVVGKLSAIKGYAQQFQEVFGTGVTPDGIARAIAAFERTVISGPSAYDRYLAGDQTALSPAARRGLGVFEGKGRCWLCHSGPMLSNQSFHNIGVGMDKPEPDVGRETVTRNPMDRGRFKTPGLRNVALTWPYFHDGSASTLDEVIEFYDQGGVRNSNLDPRIMRLRLSDTERADLRIFLESLTGTLPDITRPRLPGLTQ